jgi:hypothetical protein
MPTGNYLGVAVFWGVTLYSLVDTDVSREPATLQNTAILVFSAVMTSRGLFESSRLVS